LIVLRGEEGGWVKDPSLVPTRGGEGLGSVANLMKRDKDQAGSRSTGTAPERR